ncbi:hypothetical protein [Rhodococcus sp. USK13]|uniref:hypothetical protein n=1 Tax=Rhodococcus sp. USK13 TaxID=2806442 RepID=UPI001BCCD819|nr:hypothetical protein [Rhodococcus sp. USK13]
MTVGATLTVAWITTRVGNRRLTIERTDRHRLEQRESIAALLDAGLDFTTTLVSAANGQIALRRPPSSDEARENATKTEIAYLEEKGSIRRAIVRCMLIITDDTVRQELLRLSRAFNEVNSQYRKHSKGEEKVDSERTKELVTAYDRKIADVQKAAMKRFKADFEEPKLLTRVGRSLSTHMMLN